MYMNAKTVSVLKYVLGVLSCLLPAGEIVAGMPPSGVTVKSYVLPQEVAGVKQPVLSLNGKWDFRFTADSKWDEIRVPGEAAMQGYAVQHDVPFFYRRRFTVPSDFSGRRVILRFDGVYSHARLSINGRFVREHKGGFTRWETDVTDFVKPGRKNTVELEVRDAKDDISYASGYAHHPVGGILRDVVLFVQPEAHLTDAYVETHLDTLFRDARLDFYCQYEGKETAELELRLICPDDGRTVQQRKCPLQPGRQQVSLPVEQPVKWDAEHPYLYRLEAVVSQQGCKVSQWTKLVGFRKVEVVGNRMLVNGRPVKLRGACRHDMHPELGRSSSADYDSLDAVLFKEANMNFVRTSHYPPSERFLEFCDRYGIYVECETAVCFVNTYRQKNYAPGNSENDSLHTAQYLSQCQEMVKSFRSHPAVILWSIGNESRYGRNIQLCWDWVKAADTTRPVIFSYPGAAKEQKAKVYDVLSMHYQDVNGNLSQWGFNVQHFQVPGIPVIFDEWAHPACYTYRTLREDPGIREFWGESIDRMWSGLFQAPGGLGGAIWGYVDETFSLPEPRYGTAYWKEFAHTAKPLEYEGRCVGYGEWGIVDVWRRRKPEFWATKKAYSPVRLLDDRELAYESGQPLLLRVHNRFDHTDLTEVKAHYEYDGRQGNIVMPPVGPHATGVLSVPAEPWEEGHELKIVFSDAQGRMLDAYLFTLGRRQIVYPELLAESALTVSETDSAVVVKGKGFEVPFSKATGLMKRVCVDGEVVMEAGPFLHLFINYNHLTGAEVRKAANAYISRPEEWKKRDFAYEKVAGGVVVHLSGTYGAVQVDYDIRIGTRGQISVNYRTGNVPNGYLREAGLLFRLSDAIRQLDWQRRGYWSCYPDGAFAGNEGKVALYGGRQAAYGQRPSQPWGLDTHNYYYWSDRGAGSAHPLCQQAKGMKENIYFYRLLSERRHGVYACSPEAQVACRMDKSAADDLLWYVNNRWDYPEIAWGNYCKTLEALPCYGQVNLRLQ